MSDMTTEDEHIRRTYEIVDGLCRAAETGLVAVEVHAALFQDILLAFDYLMDDAIVLIDEEGNEVARLDEETSRQVTKYAVETYVIQALQRAIDEQP